jgi:two-component system LytT family response regulator
MKESALYNNVCLKTSIGVEFIIPSHILYCSRFNNEVQVVFVNGTKLKVLHSLKELDLYLSEFNFFRCHANCLVNINHITRYTHKTGEFHLSNGSTLVVAKDRRTEFNATLTKRLPQHTQ